MWRPYVEWTVNNDSTTGNKFDLVATVTFTHADGDTVATEMFYDGGTTWKFRFTGTVLGFWTFATVSDDPELDGHVGTVMVSENLEPNTYGFMTQVTTPMGTQWARFKGNATVVAEPFVPQLAMYFPNDDTAEVDADVANFIGAHGFSGLQPGVIGGFWFDSSVSNGKVNSSMTEPDPASFVILEHIITRVHAAGGVTHLWAWGDNEAGTSSMSLNGGINGDIEDRLIQYIAARLGPLPGWSIGYGYDLDEWVQQAVKLEIWRDKVHPLRKKGEPLSHTGWHHYMGGRPVGPNGGIDHRADAAWNKNLDYASYEHHAPNHAVYVAALGAVAGKPVMSEDRFRIRNDGRRKKDYSEEETRRGLWISTLAGGVANIWGNLTKPNGTVVSGGSLSYANPAALRTYADFFFGQKRFRYLEERDDALTDGHALRSSDQTKFVFYGEDVNRLRVDLRGAPGPLRAIAIDTTAVYAERDLGELSKTDQWVEFPTTSDWAIAVGDFAKIVAPPSPPEGLTVQ